MTLNSNRSKFRPSLESLEDRTCLSTMMPASMDTVSSPKPVLHDAGALTSTFTPARPGDGIIAILIG